MKKVIIIGAGPAGLTAGYELFQESGWRREISSRRQNSGCTVIDGVLERDREMDRR